MMGQRGFQAVIEIADRRSACMSFVNLVEAYVLAGIRRVHGVSMPKTRDAIEYVRERLNVARPLADKQFQTDGIDLFVEHLGDLVNVSRRGQQEIKHLVQMYLRRVDRDPQGVPIKLYPFTRSDRSAEQPKLVVIDPLVSFGRPVLAGTGIPTAILAERFKGGESIVSLSQDYGLEEDAILEAIRCELETRKAA